jgi:uncharacterized protein
MGSRFPLVVESPSVAVSLFLRNPMKTDALSWPPSTTMRKRNDLSGLRVLTPRKAAFAACVLLAAFNSPALGASFDCTKAGTAVEKTICGDAELSSLDEHLGRYYVVALEAVGAGAACLKSDQRRWVKTIRNSCGADAQCLSAAYLQRLAALDGFQPGASALKSMELPAAPVLVAALPPEADTVAGKAKTPMEMRGQLVWEHDDINNMGFAVKPANEQARAFVYDMSIGGGIHNIIRTLIERESAAQFLVRGMATAEGGFDDGQCRMVYRLPTPPP